jgi:pyruvate formate lyase activating enzyme
MKNSENKLRVFDIQRLCVNDGPGIRSTVFLKGCLLKCIWCHNPESISSAMQIMYIKKLCNACGECNKICTHDAIDSSFITDTEKCVCCGDCVKVCINGARKLAGVDMEIGTIIRTVLKDKAYYEESGGGVTVSGGEPMFQYEGLKVLLCKLKEEGVSTALDTSGYCEQEKLLNVCRYVDVVLFDLKHMDDTEHRCITGVGNAGILNNLRKIALAGKQIIIRYPMIKGKNDGEENIEQMCRLLKEIGVFELDVIPFHDIGINKYASLGQNAFLLEKHSDMEIKEKLACIRSFGIAPHII